MGGVTSYNSEIGEFRLLYINRVKTRRRDYIYGRERGPVSYKKRECSTKDTGLSCETWSIPRVQTGVGTSPRLQSQLPTHGVLLRAKIIVI